MIFGTDGVRGIVDRDLDYNLAYNVGKGLSIQLLNRNLQKKVIIGKDTRLSSDMLVSAISCGLSDYGIDVVIIGIVSTPMISFLVSRHDFGGGVMITASHNDYTYNGIKVFSENGDKLNSTLEIDVENNINLDVKKPLKKGNIIYNENYQKHYIDYLLNNFNIDLSDYTILLDCANGSNHKIAPAIFNSLNANVIKINCNNDGLNINNNCGANHIENLIKQVKKHDADFGFAFDGDGDRLRIVMRDGKVLSGDDILFLFAMCIKKERRLNNLTVVGTIMTNLGIEKSFLENNIRLIRTDVGDKNVISVLKENNLSLGGEPSGHICIYEHNPTCDALLNAIMFLKFYKEYRYIFDKYFSKTTLCPSMIENVTVSLESRKLFDSNLELHKKINLVRDEFEDVRLVVRPSGTEPVIRIFVEGYDEIKNSKLMQKVLKIIKDMEY